MVLLSGGQTLQNCVVTFDLVDVLAVAYSWNTHVTQTHINRGILPKLLRRKEKLIGANAERIYILTLVYDV